MKQNNSQHSTGSKSNIENLVFNLQALRQGSWTEIEKFQGNEKELAIAAAKHALAMPDIEAVKIIAESYDNQHNLIVERLVFRQSKPQKSAQKDSKFASTNFASDSHSASLLRKEISATQDVGSVFSSGKRARVIVSSNRAPNTKGLFRFFNRLISSDHTNSQEQFKNSNWRANSNPNLQQYQSPESLNKFSYATAVLTIFAGIAAAVLYLVAPFITDWLSQYLGAKTAPILLWVGLITLLLFAFQFSRQVIAESRQRQHEDATLNTGSTGASSAVKPLAQNGFSGEGENFNPRLASQKSGMNGAIAATQGNSGNPDLKRSDGIERREPIVASRVMRQPPASVLEGPQAELALNPMSEQQARTAERLALNLSNTNNSNYSSTVINKAVQDQLRNPSDAQIFSESLPGFNLNQQETSLQNLVHKFKVQGLVDQFPLTSSSGKLLLPASSKSTVKPATLSLPWQLLCLSAASSAFDDHPIQMPILHRLLATLLNSLGHQQEDALAIADNLVFFRNDRYYRQIMGEAAEILNKNSDPNSVIAPSLVALMKRAEKGPLPSESANLVNMQRQAINNNGAKTTPAPESKSDQMILIYSELDAFPSGDWDSIVMSQMRERTLQFDQIVSAQLLRFNGRRVQTQKNPDHIKNNDRTLCVFMNGSDGLGAAISIQRDLYALQENIQVPPIKPRMGMVLTSSKMANSDSMGNALNLALTLCHAAPPGKILASPELPKLAIASSLSFLEFQTIPFGESELQAFELDWK